MPGPIDAAGGLKEPTEYATLSMDTQFTGLWTQRSPLRDADVPYLYRKFYSASRFDSILDGINREISARLTDVRRAGSVEYNANSFPPANSLFSFKSLQNDGTEHINVLLDGTDGNVYDATAGGSNAVVFSKTAGAGKARYLAVNQTLYFGDSIETEKWMQPGGWQASTKVTPGSLITPGATGASQKIFMALGGMTISIIATQLATNTLTVFFDPTEVPDQFANLINASMTFSGLTGATWLNGTTQVVESVPSTTLGILLFNVVHGDYAYAAEAAGSGTTGDGTTGASVPTFSGNTGTITADGGQQWKSYGNCLNQWMPAPPKRAPTLQAINGARFWQPRFQVTAWYSILDLLGNVQVANSGGSGFVTGRSYPTFAPLSTTTVLSTQDGTVNWTNWGQIGSWLGTTPFGSPQNVGQFAVIADTNGNLQLVTSGNGGNSGGSTPTWATAIGANTSDGALTWTCLGPGYTLSTNTWQYAYSWHCIDGSVTTASPVSIIYGGILGPPEPAAGYTGFIQLGTEPSGADQIDQTYIWRTAQGQATLILDDQTAPNFDTYIEWGIPDAANGAVPGLDALVSAPIAKAGDPPPAKLTAPAFHNLRVWGIVGSTVQYSAGPDTNFNPYTAFPPLNTAQFPAMAIRLLPVTVSNGGLLVFTTSGVQVILGTGTTNNPYYATMYEPSVSLGGYDALDVLGSAVYFMESTGKVSSFDPQNGYLEIGFPIGDQFKKVTTGGISASLYDPSTAFLSWNLQSSGETAMYVADGAVGWFRMAAIAPPENGLVWCPRAAIAGGTSAVQSIETSPGNYDLLIGPAGNGPILKRDTTGAVFGDNGTSYPAWDAKGVVRLCESGQVAEVAHIALKSVATGGPRPSVSILMDELAPSAEAPWDELEITSTDPPDLEPSVSMYSDRYQALQNGVTPKGDCLLLKVDYGTNSYADELLMFSIYGRKQEERVQQQ